jgi:tight adherence protein C
MRLADRVIHHAAPQAPSAFQELQLWFRALLRPKKTSLRFSLPDVAGVLGLLLSAGLPVSVAIAWLGPRTNGEVGRLLRELTANLELGADLLAELDELATYGDPGLTELAEKLKLMVERGAGVSAQVFELAGSLRAALYRELLAKAGSNETKMLIPTVFLILPVTVLFALFPSLVVLQQSI